LLGHKKLATVLGTRVCDSRAKNESGEPSPAPRLSVRRKCRDSVREDVANGAHRKSGVVIRPSNAFQVESVTPPFLLAHFLHTPMRDRLQYSKVLVPSGGRLRECLSADGRPSSFLPIVNRQSAIVNSQRATPDGSNQFRSPTPRPTPAVRSM